MAYSAEKKAPATDGRSNEMRDRRAYVAPRLVRWGSIESLTAGGSMAADDGGSGGGPASGSS